MTTFEWKLLILNRIIALRRFAEPFQNPSNHFKNARPHLWTASAPSCFRPFIEHLATSSLSPKTIRKHVDNLWMLGGEIIRNLKSGAPKRNSGGGVYGFNKSEACRFPQLVFAPRLFDGGRGRRRGRAIYAATGR